MKRHNHSAKLIFGLIALVLCLMAAIRPVPSELEEGNDTGRYIVAFHEESRDLSRSEQYSGLSWDAFGYFTTPATWTKSDYLFLFLTATPIPLALLLFGVKGKNSLILTLGLLLSVASLELMTNAMRQGVSLFFLLAASWQNRKPTAKLVLCVISVALHASSVVFIPLIYLYGATNLKTLRKPLYYILSLILFTIFIVSFFSPVGKKNVVGIMNLVALMGSLREIYSDPPSIGFLLFTVLPVYWIFLVRFSLSPDGGSRDEKLTIIYVSILLFGLYLFFPYIVYRFMISAVLIQGLAMLKSSNSDMKTNKIVTLGLCLHTIFFLLISHHIQSIWFGLNDT